MALTVLEEMYRVNWDNTASEIRQLQIMAEDKLTALVAHIRLVHGDSSVRIEVPTHTELVYKQGIDALYIKAALMVEVSDEVPVTTTAGQE